MPVKGQQLPCLVVLASPEADEHGCHFILLSQPGKKVIVGRGSECAICLQDPAISRLHISLEVSHSTTADPTVKIRKIGTHESPILIGNKPLAPDAEGVLRSGDSLRLGNTELGYLLVTNESQLEEQFKGVIEEIRRGQYERALMALAAIKRHRPVSGLYGTSLERLLLAAQYHEARIYMIQGKWNRASELFLKLVADENPLSDLRIRAAFQLGSICIQKNDLDQAELLKDQVWGPAQALSPEEPKNGYFLSLVLCLNGMILARRRDLSGAQAAFKDATVQLQRMPHPSTTLSSRILLEQAIAAFLSEQHELALSQLEVLAKMDPLEKLKPIRAEALRYLGILYSRRRHFEMADALLLEAVQICQATQWKLLECKAQKSRAINYHSWGRLEEATVHLNLCLKMLETDVENTYEHAVVAAHLGKVYLTRGKAQEALEQFEKELGLQTGLAGVAHSQAYTHQNFARAHRNLGHREEATRYYMLAAEALGQFSNWVPQGLTLIELCRHRLESGDISGAIADLTQAEQCFAMADRSQDFADRMKAVRAQICWLQGDHSQALELFHSSITAGQPSRLDYFLAETYLLYGRVLVELHRREAERGDSAAAQRHLEAANSILHTGLDWATHQNFAYLAEQFRRELERLDSRGFVDLILSRFVCPELVERLVDNSFQDLNWHKTEVRTVLFVDLSGYTAVAEKENLNEVRDILNEFYGFATRIIQQHGGIIDKFIGDCVMAFFKGPVTGPGFENQAVAAVHAALAIVREVYHLSERRFPHERRLAASAGICTGSLLVGMLGSLQHKNYTCIGDVVNVASRLQGIAGRGQVLIAQETYRACMGAGASFWMMSDGPKKQSVKNRKETVQYWIVDTLHGMAAARSTR